MPSITAKSLINQYADDQSLELAPLQYSILLNRLQNLFEKNNGAPVNLQIVVALMGNGAIKANANGSITDVAAKVAIAIQAIQAGSGGDNGSSFPPDQPDDLLALAQSKSTKNFGLSSLATPYTEHVNTLDSGFRWGKDSLTFSFNSVLPDEYRTYGGRNLTTGWRSLTENEKNNVREIFALINTRLGIDIHEVTSNGDIRFNSLQAEQGTAGFSFYPSASALSGDIFLNRLYYDEEPSFGKGSHLYETILHEIGHALGLKHPFEGSPRLPTHLDNNAYTVMSYTHAHDIAVEFYLDAGYVYAQTVQNASHTDYSLLDIHALQSFYGANTTHNPGNNVYSIRDNEHLLIWDTGGHDMLDLSDKSGDSHIDLKPGTLSSADIKTIADLVSTGVEHIKSQGGTVSDTWPADFFTNFLNSVSDDLYNGIHNISIPLGVLIEDVRTGSGNDIIRDNYVNNVISTGAGNDVIYLGSGGFDYVDAGAGYDKVYFDINSTAAEIGLGDNQSILVVADTFAAHLMGVEELVFNNTTVYSSSLFA